MSLLFFVTERDHLGDWSPEKDCCWRLMFRQPVRKPYSESSDRFNQLKKTFDAIGCEDMCTDRLCKWRGCKMNNKQCVTGFC